MIRIFILYALIPEDRKRDDSQKGKMCLPKILLITSVHITHIVKQRDRDWINYYIHKHR